MTEEQAKCPHCGTPQPPDAPNDWLCPKCVMEMAIEEPERRTPAALFPPAVSPEEIAPHFPAYEIQTLLGRGGMGAVYRARHRKLDRLEAIKILLHEVDDDPAFTERFEREARALARLSHPGIVTIYDFGEVGGFFYLIMEYVDGANLRELLQEGRLTAKDALAFIPQICDALQYAHDAGVVHRDIKPENILIDQDGRVRIADFGLAKMLGQDGESIGLTVSNLAVGTPHYMAPEQVGGGHAIDHRADIYSLGVVLYELLTGELPIGRFAPPSEKRPCGPAFDAVVMKSLEAEPDQRYQQVREVKSELEETGDRVDEIPAPARARTSEETAQKRITTEPPSRRRDSFQDHSEQRQAAPSELWISMGLFLLVFISCWLSWGTISAEHYFASEGASILKDRTVVMSVWKVSWLGIPCWFVLVAAAFAAVASSARVFGLEAPFPVILIPASFGLLLSVAFLLGVASSPHAMPGFGTVIPIGCFAYWVIREVLELLEERNHRPAKARKRKRSISRRPSRTSRFDRFGQAAKTAFGREMARTRGKRPIRQTLSGRHKANPKDGTQKKDRGSRKHLWILLLSCLPLALVAILALQPWTTNDTTSGTTGRSAKQTIVDRAKAAGEFIVQLRMDGQKCRLACNEVMVAGDWPDTLKALYGHLRAARKLGISVPVLIDNHPDVPHSFVVGVVDECMRAKVPEVGFTGALPDLKRRKANPLQPDVPHPPPAPIPIKNR